MEQAGELAEALAKVAALVPRPHHNAIAASEHNGVRRTVGGHTWEELFQRQALVHIPYDMSTMSLFEQVMCYEEEDACVI